MALDGQFVSKYLEVRKRHIGVLKDMTKESQLVAVRFLPRDGRWVANKLNSQAPWAAALSKWVEQTKNYVSSDRSKSAFVRYNAAADKIIKRLLRTYPAYPSAARRARDGHLAFLSIRLRAWQKATDCLPTFLLEDLLTLTERGALPRLRRCTLISCRCYFYARSVGQQFCIKRHGREQARRAPEFKEKNRDYQRSYYRQYGGTHQFEWRRYYQENSLTGPNESKRHYHGPPQPSRKHPAVS